MALINKRKEPPQAMGRQKYVLVKQSFTKKASDKSLIPWNFYFPRILSLLYISQNIEKLQDDFFPSSKCVANQLAEEPMV